MDMGLNGRVAVVTGGARGIGAAIVRALAAEGCKVAVCDRDLAPARELADEIEAGGAGATALQVDVSSRAAVRDGMAAIGERLGPIDILVNNAGFSLDGPLVEMTEAQWDTVVDVCLKGSWLCAQAVAPLMMQRRYGRIINIASRAHLGEINKSNYCAAKAGVIGLTSALAIELGRFDITVNAVAPGLIRTERVRGLGHYDDIDRRARASTPIQRPGMPDDIASAVVYLASSHGGFISGETVHVTGGRYSST